MAGTLCDPSRGLFAFLGKSLVSCSVSSHSSPQTCPVKLSLKTCQLRSWQLGGVSGRQRCTMPPSQAHACAGSFFCCCSKGCCISWGQCPLKRARISRAPWGTSGRVQVSMLPQRRGLPVQVTLLGQPSCWLGGDNGHQFSSGVFRWPEAFQAVPVSPQPPLVSSPAGPCPWLMSLVPLVSVSSERLGDRRSISCGQASGARGLRLRTLAGVLTGFISAQLKER